jgi:hypothetical protein
VRVGKLDGWPPSKFQAAEVKGIYHPCKPDTLQLLAVSVVPSVSREDFPEIFLLMKDPATEQMCSTRFKVQDAGLALRIVNALTHCKGLSLAALAKIEIPSESASILRLKVIFKR